MLFLQDPMCG
ncbi:hypothetical protein E2I00_012530 [Balaenoptera physalus]|uniref:Uncharacterized protein n=2 Tax=Cetacea TaxID=9721 RepID=A0A4U1EQV2_MONMO|nr:hypothetical protein E2I00_012530 [Balaenoptera physalus]TKC38969.1 hypothetical protein EI555_005887 [Monodon monoceros]